MSSPTLNTVITSVVDSGERFAEEVVAVIEAPEDGSTVGVELDHGIDVLFHESVIRCDQLASDIRMFAAACFEAGREQGRKER